MPRMIRRDEIAYANGVTADESNVAYPWRWFCDTDGKVPEIAIGDYDWTVEDEDGWSNVGPTYKLVGVSEEHNAILYVADNGWILRLVLD